MRAGTFAGVATIIFLVIDQVQFLLGASSTIPALGVPGFFCVQFVLMSQYLRWHYSRGDGA